MELKTEEEIVQLTLTISEAAVLSALSSLGIRIVTKDLEGSKETMTVAKAVVAGFPESAMSLAKKLVILGNVTRKILKKEKE